MALSADITTQLAEPVASIVRPSRGRLWLDRLANQTAMPVCGIASVVSARVALGTETGLALAIVPDEKSVLPRARHGEMGLEQSLALAACVQSFVSGCRPGRARPPILAVVDTPGQAYGRLEEQQFLSGACGLAIEAYRAARRVGHPVLTLVVGGAFSGAFLAHGMQTDFIVALGDKGVAMHAMSAPSIARITRSTLAEVIETAARVPPMSYAIADAHRLGIIDEVIEGIDAEAAIPEDVERIRAILAESLAALRAGIVLRGDLQDNPLRSVSLAVDEAMRAQWAVADKLLPAGK